MKGEHRYVVGDKHVRNDTNELSMRQKQHYKRLLNVEFIWYLDHLTGESQSEGTPMQSTLDKLKKALSEVKSVIAVGLSGKALEMIIAASDTGASIICDLISVIICDGKVPSDC